MVMPAAAKMRFEALNVGSALVRLCPDRRHDGDGRLPLSRLRRLAGIGSTPTPPSSASATSSSTSSRTTSMAAGGRCSACSVPPSWWSPRRCSRAAAHRGRRRRCRRAGVAGDRLVDARHAGRSRASNGAPKLDGVLDDADVAAGAAGVVRTQQGETSAAPANHRRSARRPRRTRSISPSVGRPYPLDAPRSADQAGGRLASAARSCRHRRREHVLRGQARDRLLRRRPSAARQHASRRLPCSPTSRSRCTRAATTTPTDDNLMDMWQWKASRGGHPRLCRRPVFRRAARRHAGRGRGQGALPGRLLERSRPRLLHLQLYGRAARRLSRTGKVRSCRRIGRRRRRRSASSISIPTRATRRRLAWWMTETRPSRIRRSRRADPGRHRDARRADHRQIRG